jgi:hypothetical protein
MKVTSRIAISLLIFCAHFASAQTVIDLRTYFPERLNYYRTSNGVQTHFYNFFVVPQTRDHWAGRLYLDYFDQRLPGSTLMVWQKNYGGCNFTYAHLVLGGGSDKRVTEVGDWYGPACNGVYSVLGYQYPQVRSYPRFPASGLAWSQPWGLDTAWNSYQGARVFSGNWPYRDAGVNTYSSPGLVEVLPEWRPKYGRDESGAWIANPNKTYYNVARILFYHGTSTANVGPCSVSDGTNPYSSRYYHAAGYGTMALEYYMDQTHGLLQETYLYDERTTEGGTPGCSSSFPALAQSGPELDAALATWQYYIDN